jgi:hypothetical protein
MGKSGGGGLLGGWRREESEWDWESIVGRCGKGRGGEGREKAW